MKKLAVIGMVALFGASAALAGSNDYCTRSTKKCGTTVKKPLDGYGGQRDGCNEKNKKTRCGGCGKYVSEK